MIGGISVARHYGNRETTFLRQEAIGMKVWSERFVELRMSLVENLRMDVLKELEIKGAIKIVGAMYGLDTAVVEFFS